MKQLKRMLAQIEPVLKKIKGMEKQQKKRIVAGVCVAALLIGLAVMPMMAAKENENDGPVATILSDTVALGSVSASIHAGGTLTEEDAVAIRLPDGVKISEFLVENFTEIKQGDKLAAVDSVSVLKAISDVQDTLNYLKEEIEDASNNTVTKSIAAEAGGKVKAVYAQAGDDVSAVMTQYGALAVLSLDGYMAVEIETKTKLSAGDSVWVGFEDGTDVVGRVDSAQEGKAIITVEDKDYPIGTAVTVTDNDDDKIGSGELYVHHAWKAVAYSGTVSSVNLKENTTVSAGKNIFSLKEVENSSRFQMLSQQHRDYEELMTELFVMYQSGAILAPCDGVVSGVDQESIHLLSDSGSEFTISLLANAPAGQEDGLLNYVGQVTAVLGSELSFVVDAANGLSGTDLDYTTIQNQLVLDSFVMEQAGVANGLQVYEYDGTQWIGVTPQVGDILLFAVYEDSQCLWAVRLQKAVVEEPTVTPSPQPPENTQQPPTGGDVPAGGQQNPTGGQPSAGVQQPSQQMPSMNMGGMNGMSGFGGAGNGMQQEEENLYDLKGSNILYVTPQNTITLQVSVDESDVGKLRLGMEAEVTVEVLKGEIFTATITEIGVTGTDEGGNSKYTVELTMDRAENMLAGQSASAVIAVDTTEDVVVIPVAALVEQGGETVVYTGKSRGELTNPVVVTTGVSDGECVEILSGLTEGSKVYYSYYEAQELSTAVK